MKPLATPESAPQTPAAEMARKPRARRWLPLGRPARLVAGGLVAGLAALNGWWLWESRPLPEMATIANWIGEGRYPEAESALRAHLRRSPHQGEARMLLARVLAARADYEGCARQLHEVPFWWPGKPEALLREAQADLEADRAKPAEAALKACLRSDPLHPASPQVFSDAALELLKIYALEERWDQAHEIIWRAYDEAQPADHPAILGMWLRGEVERITPEDAAQTLARYVAAVPDDYEALRALARDEQALRRPAEARRHIDLCVKARPADANVWRDYLWIVHQQGDREALDAALVELPKSADSVADIWKFRGLAREQSGDLAGAADAYRKAIALRPAEPEYHYRLAQCEERLGHHALAAQHRQRSKALREAAAALREAYQQFLDANQKHGLEAPETAKAITRLASLCETLGWPRLADAWRKLVPESLHEGREAWGGRREAGGVRREAGGGRREAGGVRREA